MKKRYTIPMMETFVFDAKEIITTSGDELPIVPALEDELPIAPYSNEN